MQAVKLDKHTTLLDSPGVVFAPQQSADLAAEALRSYTKVGDLAPFTLPHANRLCYLALCSRQTVLHPHAQPIAACQQLQPPSLSWCIMRGYAATRRLTGASSDWWPHAGRHDSRLSGRCGPHRGQVSCPQAHGGVPRAQL